MNRSCYGLYVSPGCDRVEVLDGNKQSVLYSAKVQRLKPQLSISRPSTAPCDELIALATFYKFSSDVDIQMSDGKKLNMHGKSLSGAHSFGAAGFRWSWRRDGFMGCSFRLTDDTSTHTVATFSKDSSLSGKMLGVFVIFGNHQSAIIDAIVVSGLAKIGYQWLAQKAKSGR